MDKMRASIQKIRNFIWIWACHLLALFILFHWRSPVNRKRGSLTLPEFWELFSFCLPGKVRKQVFKPAYNDMLESYLLAQSKYKKWRKLLIVAFTIRTVWMVFQCLKETIGEKTFRVLIIAVPALRFLKYLRWW